MFTAPFMRRARLLFAHRTGRVAGLTCVTSALRRPPKRMVPRLDLKNSTQSDIGLAGSGSGANFQTPDCSLKSLIHDVVQASGIRRLIVWQIAPISRKNWFDELIVTYN